MRWIGSWWALIGIIALWSLCFGSVVLQMFATVDACADPTDAGKQWCKNWMELFDPILMAFAVAAWLSGLVVVTLVWRVIRRRRRGYSQQES